MFVAEIILWICGLYLTAGLVFAIIFLWRGVAALDPSAAGTTLAFRAVILPGCVALWPWLLVRWFGAKEATS
jgi:hypothetical protein